MDEKDFMELLMEALDLINDEEYRVKNYSTFEREGILTTNNGLVVKTKDGDAFQITIVKS